MTPEEVDARLAAAHPGQAVPPVRFAGAVPPDGLRWLTTVPGEGVVSLDAPVTLAEVLAAAQVDHPGGAPADTDRQRSQLVAGQHLHARLARQLRRAHALGLTDQPHPADPSTSTASASTAYGATALTSTDPTDDPTAGPGPIDLTAADLRLAATLLDARRVADRLVREPQQGWRYLADLLEAAGSWLDQVDVTPATVDDPVQPVHETRCALAASARSLLAQILHASGVNAPERM